jgi:hypothetical protein
VLVANTEVLDAFPEPEDEGRHALGTEIASQTSRQPGRFQGCRYGTWALLDDIHPRHPKERGCCEEVLVVGVDLGGAVFCCGGQMDGIGGSELGARWGSGEDGFDAVDDGVREG